VRRNDWSTVIDQAEFVARVQRSDPDVDIGLVTRAFDFSHRAHGTQVRASGEPYFSHPLEVAGIVADMRLDAASVATALLHDTVEDTVATLEQIDAQFGSEIAQLVDGVTKLTMLEHLRPTQRSREAENFRKLLVAMSNDLRVLMVKLADRLHNMRTLSFIAKPERRHRIAAETMDIYAPLAERIGMHAIKDELEDLAFAELNHEARNSIVGRLDFLRSETGDIIARITQELEQTLGNAGLEATVFGREKRPYSIWRKMERKNISFEQLADVMAFRILVDTADDCYRALGIVHRRYSMVPERFKDFVSTPKPNGYRSIHTTVIGPQKRRIEIQIRTHDMNAVAEYGVAAHWQYKDGVALKQGAQQYSWIRQLLEILEHGGQPEEFLEHTKLEMYQDQVFCFSPRGDLIALPRGATPVDFAYAVHSDIGDTCVGAKVNGRIAPLRTVLENGDQVEIMRSSAQTPSPTWLNFVATGKARSAIRRFVRVQQDQQYVDLGSAILERAFQKAGHEINEKALERALTVLRLKTPNELYAHVGQGFVSGKEVLDIVFPAEGERRIPSFVRAAIRRVRAGRDVEKAIPIKGLIKGVAVHFADCCHPLPGDRIVGILTEGKGVRIHTIDCETLRSFGSSPESWLDVSWDIGSDSDDVHLGRIKVTLTNEPGALNALTGVIARNNANITNLKVSNRSDDFFEFLVDVEVRDVKHMTGMIAALRAEERIHKVDRVRA
jgi:GTP diphosphokinase / guanosine-3',5'-bis(diphosphate) 3'-diphosphatase